MAIGHLLSKDQAGGMSSQQRLVLFISILASFVAFLDGSVVNVALPALSRDLGGGLVTQQWVVDAYLITLGSLILLAGSLSDLFGRQRILVIGLAGFGITSILCALAPSGTFLILTRALQGTAGALLVPSSLALIIASFSGRLESKAIGNWTAWTGLSYIIGPILGGFLVDSLSWRWIFAINVLPIAVCLWLLSRLQQSESSKQAKVDMLGALFCSLGLAGSVFGLIEQPHYCWHSPVILGPLLAGIVLLTVFVWYENHHLSPMLPLGLFKIRNFWVGNLATLAIYGGLSVASFLVIIFLQQANGYSALMAGMSLLPVTIIMFLLSPHFGMLSGKYGPRFFMAAGPIVASFGFLLMLRLGIPAHYWSELLPGVLVFALGLSMTVAPLTAAVLGSVDARFAGIDSAVNNAVARIAGLITIAAIGIVVGTRLDLQSFRSALVATAILIAIGGVVSAIGIRNNRLPVTIEK